MLNRLTEADTRIDHDPLAPDTGGERELHAFLEESAHLGHDVAVAWRALHRPRLAEHVHQTAVDIARRHQLRQLRLGTKRRDVVDVARAGVERGAGDRDLRGVDRDLGEEAGVA